ncbi:MAG TPA: amidohydrolase family protein [Planctomycetota bacterium]|nr:amidohydrolase family protein [Planctomycetota bacterium]
MLIDAHVHLFSRRFYQFWADEARVPIEQTAETLKAEIPDDDSVPLGERWIAELDKYKVDRCVLISSVTGDGGALGKTVQKHPSRLSGLFYLNPTLQDAMQRVRRGVEEAGLRGACFFPAMHHYQPDDERLHPIFATLDRAGVVAFVHLGMFKMPIQEKLGLPPSADLKYSNPIALHSVCNAFQNLKFIIPHFGSGFFQETLMLGTLCKNVYIDTSSSNSWIKLFPGLTLESVFERALDIFGPDRVIFGTDSSSFPRGWREDNYKRQKQALEKIGAPKSDQEKIFGGNIAKLLKI